MIELRVCIEQLASEDEADRIYAAEDIGYANTPEGVPALFASLPMERSRAVREAIFAALGQIDCDAVIEGCVQLLDSDDSFLRNQAVEVLRARGAKAVPHLGRAFREGNSDRRKFVIDVVAKLGDASESEIYELGLADPDLNVVITTVESLGAMRRTAFRERIESLLSPQAHPMLLSACIEALAEIGEHGSITVVQQCFTQQTGIPGYLQASYLKLVGAKGGREDVGEVAALIGEDRLEPHVLNALASLRSRFRDLALPASLAESLERIACGATSPLPAYQAIRLMAGLLHVEDVLRFLEGCLGHPEKAIRIAAIQALREAGSNRTDNILLDCLSRETDDEVLQALGR